MWYNECIEKLWCYWVLNDFWSKTPLCSFHLSQTTISDDCTHPNPNPTPAPIKRTQPVPTPSPASWQRRNEAKPTGFGLMRCWNARISPVWGQKSTKWTSRVVANKARACSKSVCCERGRKRRWVRWEIRRVSSEPCRVCAKTPWGFRNLSDIRKHSHNSPQYHKYSQTIPPITWWCQNSPNFTGFHRTIPGTT